MSTISNIRSSSIRRAAGSPLGVNLLATWLLHEEGLFLGSTSGVNVAAAVQIAKRLGPGHTIVTILCDYGTRYQSKLFNPDFLRSKNLPVPAWLERKSTIDPGLV